MLKANQKQVILSFAVLHIFISIFTSHASADDKLAIAEDYRTQGYAEQQKGNYTEALTFYSKALSLGLHNPVVYNDMGILYEQLGLNARAEQYYLQSLKQDGGYLPAYTNLAYLHLNNGNNVKAREYFQRRYELAPPGDPWAPKIEQELIKLNPAHKQILIEREADKLQQELVDKARQEFANIVIQANEHIKKAEEYAAQNEHRLALQEYDKALAITPNNPQILKAKKKIMLVISKEKVKRHSDQAIRMLESGNSTSARTEIQKMLTSIPSEQVLNSKK